MNSATATLSRKLSDDRRGFAGASAYDGVYASPTERSGGAVEEEDYREIFGGSGATAIPFLDAPELSEGKVSASVEARSSKVDYSSIFGGVAASSFAPRYDELSPEVRRRKKSGERWSPADKFTSLESSEDSTYTDGSGVLSPQSSTQSFSGAKKFNMSYNQVSRDANGTSGTNITTHIAQVNAVQGYAQLFDEVTPTRTESIKPAGAVSRENGSTSKSNHSIRASMNVRAETEKQNLRGDIEFQNSPNWFKSTSMDKSVNLRSKYSKSESTEGSSGVCSPPYFDEELDTNSVAATSSAALRKAIDDAQAKIKVAKEIMERKKAGLRNGAKSSSSRLKPEESVGDKVVSGVDRSKKSKTRERREDVKIPLSVSSESKPGFEVWEKRVQSSDNGETPFNQIPKQADCIWEDAEASETEQFYDVENTNESWPPIIEVDIPHGSVVSETQTVAGLGHAAVEFKVKQIVSGASETDEEALLVEYKRRQADLGKEKAELVDAAEQFYEIDGNDKIRNTKSKFEEVKRMQSVGKNSQKYEEVANEEKPQACLKGSKPADCLYSQEEIEKRIQLIYGSTGTSEYAKTMQDAMVFDNEIEEDQVLLKQGDRLEEVQAFNETETFEKSSMEFLEPVRDGKQLEISEPEDPKHVEIELTSWECGGSEKNGEEYFKQKEHGKEQNDDHDMEDEDEMFFNKASTDKRMEQKFNRFHLGKEIAKILLHDDEPEGSEKILDDNSSQKEEEGVQDESDEGVATGRINTNSSIEEGDEEYNLEMYTNQASNGKRMEQKLSRYHLGKEIAKILLHDDEPEESEKIFECYSPPKEKDNLRNESDEWVATGRTSTDSGSREGDGIDASVGLPTNRGSDLQAANNILEKDENDELSKNQDTILLAEIDETIEMSEEVHACKGGARNVDELSNVYSDDNDSTKESDGSDEKDEEKEDHFPVGFELSKIMKPLEDKTNSDFMGENDTGDVGGVDWSFDRKTTDQPDCQLEIVHDSSEHSEEMASEVEQVEKYIRVSEVSVNQKDDEKNIECFGEWGLADDGTNMKDAQSPDRSKEEQGNAELEEEMETSPRREKDHGSRKETKGSQEVEVNEIQSADTNKETDEATVPVKESTPKERLQKGVEPEKEHPRRVDAAKEKEREIEKGRIAVERAVREARERAFAEARERALAEVRERVTAGRAASEARQRVMAEDNAKSVAEKASREAKLKAERAAVERATSEARVRALEKAMSSKAASEAKKQNPEHKGTSSTSTSSYPSSNYDTSSSSENYNRAESTQRSKARTERHQRISERAQKALAEKNRRDLLVQKEQAEKNRLAETLDFEVKRWSSGKEGNLRALLSTLQYILGPDSGWQAIPLTDVIKTAAAKKAYRKATLCVHPDKLQQRGANIQQKYICEKVFDLLKEAWNKFNVEER